MLDEVARVFTTGTKSARELRKVLDAAERVQRARLAAEGGAPRSGLVLPLEMQARIVRLAAIASRLQGRTMSAIELLEALVSAAERAAVAGARARGKPKA